MELVKQHQQDLRTATQFWHGARRVLTVTSGDKVGRLLSPAKEAPLSQWLSTVSAPPGLGALRSTRRALDEH